MTSAADETSSSSSPSPSSSADALVTPPPPPTPPPPSTTASSTTTTNSGNNNNWLDWQDGTPLRAVIKECRLGLNGVVVSSKQTWNEVEERCETILETAQAHTSATLGRLGVEGKALSELRKNHPNLFIGGATALVAIPSALAGKRVMLRNGVLVAVVTSGMTYGAAWWQRLHKK